MRISELSPDAALAALRSSRDGLTSAEAERRAAEFGSNRLEEVRRAPLWKRLLRQFTHLFAVVLWVAAALAFWGALRDPASGMSALGAAIVGVIVVNGLFSFWQERRAEEAIAALKAVLPPQATVLRDGVAQRLPVESLVPGDVVLVQEGDDVPADCRLIDASGLRVNVATLSGESLPRPRTPAPDEEPDSLAARCLLLAGTAVVAGEGRALVYATGMRTEFGRIVQLTQTAGEPPSPLQLEIVRLSRLVAAAAALLGVVFFVIGQAIGLDFRLLGQLPLRHRHHRRQRAGRAAADRHFGAGHGHAAHGPAQRADPPPGRTPTRSSSHGSPPSRRCASSTC